MKKSLHLLSIRLRSGHVYDLPREMAALPTSWGELFTIDYLSKGVGRDESHQR